MGRILLLTMPLSSVDVSVQDNVEECRDDCFCSDLKLSNKTTQSPGPGG